MAVANVNKNVRCGSNLSKFEVVRLRLASIFKKLKTNFNNSNFNKNNINF